MDAPGEVTELLKGDLHLAVGLVHHPRGRLGVVRQLLLRQTEVHGEGDEPGLCPVVEVPSRRRRSAVAASTTTPRSDSSSVTRADSADGPSRPDTISRSTETSPRTIHGDTRTSTQAHRAGRRQLGGGVQVVRVGAVPVQLDAVSPHEQREDPLPQRVRQRHQPVRPERHRHAEREHGPGKVQQCVKKVTPGDPTLEDSPIHAIGLPLFPRTRTGSATSSFSSPRCAGPLHHAEPPADRQADRQQRNPDEGDEQAGADRCHGGLRRRTSPCSAAGSAGHTGARASCAPPGVRAVPPEEVASPGPALRGPGPWPV
ncbi:hypothetical protein SMICM17S_04031 [Streptomyces microflavus]